MGQAYRAVCKKCGHRFMVRNGPGMRFFLLHCDSCGRERSLDFDEVSVIEKERNIDTVSRILFDKEYEKMLEGALEPCECGGRFTFKAKPRCPKCGSKSYEHYIDENGTSVMICYD